MINLHKAACLALGMLLFSCSTQDLPEDSQNPAATTTKNTSKTSKNAPVKNNISKLWDFKNLDEWEDATQVGVPNYFIENENLRIFTNANTWDRTKVKSIATYTTGNYSWRIYIPEMGVGDCASIGAFLYSDDTHELDFEIGYGNTTIREQLNALSDDLIVYSTSQGNPFYYFQNKIKRGQWYTFTIELTLNNKKRYVATWKIDNQILTTKTLTYDTQTKFKIFCSVENLAFIGDHIPYSQNYALFDWVTFNQN